ncbi:MAG: Threonylcarbamoyl-AMP synthase [Candidatus Anoxychlamydiales bacterium]|nr:Threonylcarbamoyl-AMP synthase [Candidatus Anoxychlamydiales bacterium]NGX40323.1 Threonylcarbamoyl-AMP synthase [Candidatus Anoxychlamydiales bacterium]
MKTKIFSKKNLTDQNFKNIVDYLNESKVIAFPTETVYGLGAHMFKEEAIEKIYTLKKRDKNKALIVHLGSIEDVKRVAIKIPNDFYILANRFFPGPLTIILKKNPKISSLISSDLTIALRMPDNYYTQKLINLLGSPIVGTSANISNRKSPVNAKMVLDAFLNKIPAIIDTGECELKIPSTIISLVEKPYKILRIGSISKEQIDKTLKISR